MASRHINILRKYQKVILAVMGVILMVTFTIGSPLSYFSGGRESGRDQNSVAVRWKGGKLREHELAMRITTHRIAVNFLRYLIAKAVDRGGSPVVSGQTIPKDTPLGQIMQMDPGIASDPSEQGVVRTMLLARKAEEMGVAVDHESVKEFLRQLGGLDVPESEWANLVEKASPHEFPMTVGQMLDQLVLEIKAQHMRVLAQAGLFAVSPGDVWEYHNRLNRRFTIEACPIAVADLKTQVSGQPSDTELRAMFEKGKNNDPNPVLAEPGFHKPHKVAFEYLKVDFAQFLEEAKKQISPEQIAKQYELDIAQGKHKKLELPTDPTKPTDKPADKPADGEKPAGGEPPAAEKEKAADKPAADKPAEPKSGETPKPEAKPEAKPGDKSAEKPPSGDDPTTATAAAAAAKADDKPAAKPADPRAAKKPVETKPELAKPADAKPADAKPADTKPTETKPGETTPPADKPAETKPGDPKAVPPPKFKTLEEATDDIRKELAQPIAQEALNAAVKKAMDEINAYGRKYRRWKGAQEAQQAGAKTTSATDPGPLNLEGLAAKYGFKQGSTPLVDRHQVGEYEIGKKVMEFDPRALQMGRFSQFSFADLAYGRGDLAYNPQQANSIEPDISYIFWRTDEVQAADPKFEEVKDQVLDDWKQKKAFELARAEAQKLAEKAKSAKSLADVVDPTKVITTAPFSWLTTGSLAFGFGEPSLSSIPGIDLAGQEFMEGVFTLIPGETGIAPNRPHTKVYVVRAVSQDPTDDVLREQFLESGMNFQVIGVAREQMMRTSLEWYDNLEKEMGLVWERPPAGTSHED